MTKNILLGYLLGFLRACWFWLGVWVFYYLQFTDYAGIGLLESIMIITWILLEVPTGALTDLIGKKRALIMAFLLLGIGNFVMGGAVSFFTLGLGIFIGSIGLAFFSGTHEAFLYDTLKSLGQEKLFDQVIGKANSFNQLGMAVGGIFSGVLYNLNPSFPFYLVGLFGLIGAIVGLFLDEPKVDTQKFSIVKFVKQNRTGLRQLWLMLKTIPIVPLIFAVAAIWVISDEVLESVLAVEFGFSPTNIGPFFALIYLVSAGASRLTPHSHTHSSSKPQPTCFWFERVIGYFIYCFAFRWSCPGWSDAHPTRITDAAVPQRHLAADQHPYQLKYPCHHSV